MATSTEVNKINKLDALLETIPMIHKMLPDIGIGVTNKEEWLAYYPGRKIDLRVTTGSIIDPQEPLADCIANNKLIKEEVPAEFFGFSFTGLASPIVEDGAVIGALAIQIQEQNEKELRRISDQIFQSLTHANDRITSISNGAEELSSYSDTLQKETSKASDGMKNTDEVINFIKNIATQTNVLGLNASIEAARAGDKGLGFNVVAKEIRKLSNETVASADEISNTLKDMQLSIEQINSLVEKVVTVGRKQAQSTEEISAFIDEIEEMSRDLKKYAAEL